MFLISRITKYLALRSSKAYISYLRKKGVSIGERCIIRDPKTSLVDLTRPSLISIGDDVDMNRHFQILTHDWASAVFRNKYKDFVNSSGKVTIGNNVYFGTNVIILKGVSIGDNCIIGAGSLVNRSIPEGSVAAGVPCKVICSLDDYYKRRKIEAKNEAKEFILSIRKRYGRMPKVKELKEEFIYFVDKTNIEDYSDIPIKKQLGNGYSFWLETHKKEYEGLNEFLQSINNE